ncbi:hypothetical protein MTR_1g087480 [Medicago truncatula]|uniref:Uncharacterized protein n=1 Tax=Medicago truncatula TaxID=3880 RepID=G7IDU1_MEDTR|nr:hypothetical protein MTR_1g087480 [Medicago truncatula]
MGSGWVHVSPLLVPYPCFKIGENPNPIKAKETRQIGIGLGGLFTLFVSLCEEIERVMNSFWWGHSKFYNARYFPRCNFFQSTLEHKLSFVWRSICSSKFILKTHLFFFFCVLWSIWKQRYNKVWNEVVDPQTFVVDQAKTMLQEWLAARLMRNTSISLPKQVGNAKWTKSSIGGFKCNIDASFSKQTNRVGIGVCIMDDTCTFVLAKTEWFSPICEVHVG